MNNGALVFMIILFARVKVAHACRSIGTTRRLYVLCIYVQLLKRYFKHTNKLVLSIHRHTTYSNNSYIIQSFIHATVSFA